MILWRVSKNFSERTRVLLQNFISLDLELQYILDAKKDKKKRLFFLKQEGESQRNQSITVTKGRVWRQSFKAHLPASGIDDKLTSIDIQVIIKLTQKWMWI